MNPLRKVIKTITLETKYNRWGEGSYRFILECGHDAVAKQSAGTPKKKRCRDCGMGRPAVFVEKGIKSIDLTIPKNNWREQTN